MDEKIIKEQIDIFSQQWKSIERVYEDYVKSEGLTIMSFTVLEILLRNAETCTQKLICEQSHYNKQSVNMIIKSFWEQGYVELKEIKSDRRNKQVRLSKKGLSYTNEIMGKLYQVENTAMEALTNEQRQNLIELSGIYEENFCKGIYDLINSKNPNDARGEILD